MSFLGIDVGKMFSPKGTGGVQANLKTQEQILGDARAAQQPMRNAFTGFMSSPNGDQSQLPSWMQVPDWQKTGQQVYDANNALGQRTVQDLFTKNNADLQGSMLRRGQVYGSSGSTGSMADLQNWYETESAKERTNALMQKLSTGQSLRGESGKNFWDILQFLGNTDSAAGFGNVANQYGQIGANQMASLSELMKAAGMVAGGG